MKKFHLSKLRLVSLLILPGSLSLASIPARADFYRYVGEDGVETFTNTPSTPGAVRVLREAKVRTRPVKEHATEALEPPAPGEPPRLPVNGTVTSKVGWRHDPIDGGIRHHNGVDIAVPSGTRVKAIMGGKVRESGFHGGYGNLVVIEHPGGMTSLYGHNSKLEVKAGDTVQAGDVIAYSGSTGRSTGPHLHFELWKSGNNVTQAYLENGVGIPEVSGGIRSYLHADGSIVFTNLH
ncbi:M23 family metallopeptidase [Geomonas sp. Red32]|uniref:peptidoglycan DD-metalloendopeptidase family protein n=1 Tax=Geomonas sp. Red32 TaxID=2912856 RepID=UPI00202CDBD3|nr:M23 family metallopeptidase [Geomonas sp. Red32]MCM0082314.1 M23 family metallopeptidase [Geomonas sp. Red32]